MKLLPSLPFLFYTAFVVAQEPPTFLPGPYRDSLPDATKTVDGAWYARQQVVFADLWNGGPDGTQGLGAYDPGFTGAFQPHLDRQWNRRGGEEPTVIAQSRGIFGNVEAYGAARALGGDGTRFLTAAEAGGRVLIDRFRDPTYGGYYWKAVGDTQKQGYGQMHAWLALCRLAVVSPDPRWLAEATRQFELVQSQLTDPAWPGAVLPGKNRDFTRVLGVKNIDTFTHYFETLQAYWDVAPAEKKDEAARALVAAANLLVDRLAVPIPSDQALRMVAYNDSDDWTISRRPYSRGTQWSGAEHASPGHAAELAFLVSRAVERGFPARWLVTAKALLDGVLKYAVDRVTGGLLYETIGYHHNEMGEVYSALFAFDEQNLTLRGEGTLDLSGLAFYHLDRPSPVTTVGPEVTQAHLDEAPRTYDWRVNQPVFFHRCHHLRLDGLTITNAPCWTLSFNLCADVKVTHLTIDNSLVLPNNDGMHFTGSRDILISGCHITAGDNCVALSSITDWDVPCENVVITDCVFQSASKAISVGYMHSIVRNVLIANVVVKKSNRAFVSMCHPGTGLVENVRVTNCLFEGRSYGGNWWGNGEALVLMVTPHHIDAYRDPIPERRFAVGIRNVTFSGLICRAERPIGVVASEPMITGVRFCDVVVETVTEEKPSLKGNVIDLAPGPENYLVPRPGIGLVYRNAVFDVDRVVGTDGKAIACVTMETGC